MSFPRRRLGTAGIAVCTSGMLATWMVACSSSSSSSSNSTNDVDATDHVGDGAAAGEASFPGLLDGARPDSASATKGDDAGLANGDDGDAGADDPVEIGLRLRAGALLFMSADLACGPDQNAPTATCYESDPTRAANVVAKMTALGVWHFLLPAMDVASHYTTLGGAIADAGGYFYTYEGYRRLAAVDAGAFDCAAYRAEIGDLVALKAKYPAAFRGMVLQDEPNAKDFAALTALRQCIQTTPGLAGLALVQNLSGLYATEATIAGTGMADEAPGSEYGFTCTGANTNGGTSTAIAFANNWTSYVGQAATAVTPDLLGFDQYVFTGGADDPAGFALGSCDPPRDYLVSSATAGVRSVASAHGEEPFTFVQNWSSGSTLAATAAELIWSYASSIAFGVKRFALFVSHDFGPQVGGATTNFGLLHPDGTPSALYATAMATTPTFAIPLARALDGYTAIDFAASWLGVARAKYVSSVSTGDVTVGEYELPGSTGAPMLFVANVPVDAAPAATTVALSSSWARIEQFAPSTATWTVVGTAANSISYAGAAASGGTLYRLDAK